MESKALVPLYSAPTHRDHRSPDSGRVTPTEGGEQEHITRAIQSQRAPLPCLSPLGGSNHNSENKGLPKLSESTMAEKENEFSSPHASYQNHEVNPIRKRKSTEAHTERRPVPQAPQSIQYESRYAGEVWPPAAPTSCTVYGDVSQQVNRAQQRWELTNVSPVLVEHPALSGQAMEVLYNGNTIWSQGGTAASYAAHPYMTQNLQYNSAIPQHIPQGSFWDQCNDSGVPLYPSNCSTALTGASITSSTPPTGVYLPQNHRMITDFTSEKNEVPAKPHRTKKAKTDGASKPKKRKNDNQEPELCKEQNDLVDLIARGKNVFYTGSAGVGKSTVLKAFVNRLREMNREVDIIAPTGRAALDINGSTTWTYAGWTPDHMKKPLQSLRAGAHGKFVRKRLLKTDVLVIDEISMVENHHFERINAIMKEARGRDEAFGGVQIVVTGDFCQLPPVKPFQHCIECGSELRSDLSKTSYTCPRKVCKNDGPFLDEDKWAFRSKAWAECDFAHVHLQTIHRQSDKKFINILQKCRLGQKLSTEEEKVLTNHASNTKNAVRLFSTREEVRRVNDMEFNRLTTQKYTFQSFDHFDWNQQHRHLEWKGRRNPIDGSLLALAEHRFESQLNLKEGMQVVLQINLNIKEGLVNGSQGIIKSFEPMDEKDIAKICEKWRQADMSQQESMEQAASTVRGIYASVKEENVKAFVRNARDRLWPVVKFENGQMIPIYCDCTISELGDDPPYSLISRTQIPLLPAWAMSIHKAQGMTLNRVEVDLSRSFEDGQMYVALSRARSLQGLKVTGLKGSWQGGGNQQVRDFLTAKFGPL